MALSRQGKTQEFFDKFKAGLRTHKVRIHFSRPQNQMENRQTLGAGIESRRVSNAALANAALVLSSKNWKKYSRWGAASKNKSKKPWASIFTLSPCRNRCRSSESAIFFSQVHPPSKIKLNKNSKH